MEKFNEQLPSMAQAQLRFAEAVKQYYGESLKSYHFANEANMLYQIGLSAKAKKLRTTYNKGCIIANLTAEQQELMRKLYCNAAYLLNYSQKFNYDERKNILLDWEQKNSSKEEDATFDETHEMGELCKMIENQCNRKGDYRFVYIDETLDIFAKRILENDVKIIVDSKIKAGRLNTVLDILIDHINPEKYAELEYKLETFDKQRDDSSIEFLDEEDILAITVLNNIAPASKKDIKDISEYLSGDVFVPMMILNVVISYINPKDYDELIYELESFEQCELDEQKWQEEQEYGINGYGSSVRHYNSDGSYYEYARDCKD